MEEPSPVPGKGKTDALWSVESDAYLCDTHARSAAPVAAPPLSPLTSFEAKAKSLVKVGRDLDKAIAGYKPAKSRLDDAMRAWRDAVAKVSGGDTQ